MTKKTTEMHPVTIKLPTLLYKRLKIHCAQNGLKIQNVVAHIVALHLREHTVRREKC